MVFTEVHKSPIPIRWAVNFISRIGYVSLIRGLRLLPERETYASSFYFKVWNFTKIFSDRWGTYFEVDRLNGEDIEN